MYNFLLKCNEDSDASPIREDSYKHHSLKDFIINCDVEDPSHITELISFVENLDMIDKNNASWKAFKNQ